MVSFRKIIVQIPKTWFLIFIYFLVIGSIVLLFDTENFFSSDLIKTRIIFLIAFCFLLFLRKRVLPQVFILVNIIIVYTLLSLLYKETAYLNTLIFPKIDDWLIRWDQAIFGFQPSLQFSQKLNQCFFNEVFFFGYFSYYLMPVFIVYFLYKNKKEKLEEFGFILIGSFLFYYILFILFPAVGPQFYYTYPVNHIESCGFFGKSVQLIQQIGESPTGAFPSSHVGVSVIMLIWVFFNYSKAAQYFLLVVLILIFSTVYIKAHYAIDAIAGIITAPVIYYLLKTCYRFLATNKR